MSGQQSLRRGISIQPMSQMGPEPDVDVNLFTFSIG